MYIQDISNRGKLPIIVGGTHYYIEALLWFQHLAEESTSEKEQKSEELAIESKEEETNEDEYKLLEKIDPIMAAKVHPNNKRKIKHYLEVFSSLCIAYIQTYRQTGKKQSEYFAESKKELRY